MKKISFFVTFLVMLASSNLFAGDFEQYEAAYNAGSLPPSLSKLVGMRVMRETIKPNTPPDKDIFSVLIIEPTSDGKGYTIYDINEGDSYAMGWAVSEFSENHLSHLTLEEQKFLKDYYDHIPAHYIKTAVQVGDAWVSYEYEGGDSEIIDLQGLKIKGDHLYYTWGIGGGELYGETSIAETYPLPN